MNIQQQKVLDKYVKIKNFDIKDFSRNDWGRTMKRINDLLDRTGGDGGEVCKAIDWIVGFVGGRTWTLETVDKHWLEYLKSKKKNKPMVLSAEETDELLRKMGAIK